MYCGNFKDFNLKIYTYFVPVFGVAVINTTISPGFIFPSDDIKMIGSEKIDIPSSVFVSGKNL